MSSDGNLMYVEFASGYCSVLKLMCYIQVEIFGRHSKSSSSRKTTDKENSAPG